MAVARVSGKRLGYMAPVALHSTTPQDILLPSIALCRSVHMPEKGICTSLYAPCTCLKKARAWSYIELFPSTICLGAGSIPLPRPPYTPTTCQTVSHFHNGSPSSSVCYIIVVMIVAHLFTKTLLFNLSWSSPSFLRVTKD